MSMHAKSSLPLTGRDQGWGDGTNNHAPPGVFEFVFKAFADAHMSVPPPTPNPSPRRGRGNSPFALFFATLSPAGRGGIHKKAAP